MKKISFIFVLGLLALSFNSFSQIKVNSSGQVGINQSSPAYDLDWFGTGRFWSSGWGQFVFDNSGYGNVVTMHPADDWVGCLGTSSKKFNIIYVDHLIAREVTETSDETMKENIEVLDNSLEKVIKLKGVKYDLKKEYFKSKDSRVNEILEEKRKNEIGFLAQDLMEIFPEVVYLDDTSNLYSVNYSRLVPVLAEAIKEQQVIIEDLAAKIESIESDCCDKMTKSASVSENEGVNTNLKTAILYQNNPNPFKNKTEIRCYIPNGSITSMLHIFNMQGTQLEQIAIVGTGNKSVNIDGNKLKPGMYLYSLVIDGREIDTKRMILTK